MENAARIFARGFVNLTSILDSKLIILGGSVLKNWDVLKPLIEREYYNSFPPLTAGVKIVRSGLLDYAGDTAALSLVMPGAWIARWQKERPWESAPEMARL